MRVLFSSTAGRGHVGPMLPLAHALREQGHEVAWATFAANAEWLAGEGFAVHPAGVAKGVMWSELLARPELRSLTPEQRPDHFFQHIFGPVRTAPMLADLLPIVDDMQPDLIVGEQAEFAAPIAAARAGIPNVSHGFGALLPEARVARAGEAHAELWREHGLEPRPYGGTYDHLYLHIYPPALDDTEAPHVEALQTIRPAVARPPAPEEGLEPLVYVTFGTVFTDDPAPLRRFVEGVARLPVRVLVTIGPTGDEDAFSDVAPNVEVARFIPQAQTLPRCAAVISHGGSGTFLAALAHGLPQLLIPQGADQYLNAAAAQRSGIGLVLRAEDADPEAVHAAAERLLSDAAIAGAARRGATEMAAMPDPETVAAQLAARYG